MTRREKPEADYILIIILASFWAVAIAQTLVRI